MYYHITEEEEKRLYEAMQDGYTAVGFKYAEVKGMYILVYCINMYVILCISSIIICILWCCALLNAPCEDVYNIDVS